MFSEVYPFMVQKTFETNLKHDARSVLFPPSCVHFWLDIAECFMFKDGTQTTLLQDDTQLFWSLETSPCTPLYMECHTVPAWMDSWDLHQSKQQK